MARPLALITNDDSIRSPLLGPLVEAASTVCDVYVVAPATEQSWIGRAYSRHRTLDIVNHDKFDVPTWTVSGTPSDCANIGIHHLLPRQPDIVLSGINIGYNATSTFIYSSGTVAGALEGAFHEVPAIAFSKALPPVAFESITERYVIDDPEVLAGLNIDETRIPEIIRAVLQAPRHFGQVWNVNFPEFTRTDTRVCYTEPARIKPFSFYQIDEQHRAHFHFTTRDQNDLPDTSDIAALRRGEISISALEFSRLQPSDIDLDADPLNLQQEP